MDSEIARDDYTLCERDLFPMVSVSKINIQGKQAEITFNVTEFATISLKGRHFVPLRKCMMSYFTKRHFWWVRKQEKNLERFQRLWFTESNLNALQKLRNAKENRASRHRWFSRSMEQDLD